MDTRVFDAEKFEKILNLMNATSFEAERENARARAEEIAKAAGMSFDDAVQLIYSKNINTNNINLSSYNPFENFDDLIDKIDPDYRKKAADEMQRREEEKSKIIHQYGSIEEVFKPCEKELLLKKACENLVQIDESNERLFTLDGWRTYYRYQDMPESVRIAVKNAYEIPNSVKECWDELVYWADLYNIRTVCSGYYDHDIEVSARIVVLEELVCALPARSAEDVYARIERFQYICNAGVESIREDDRFVEQFRRDVAFLANGVESSRQAPFTNAQKRDAVLDYLTCPERSKLSDREIARIVGVSPQTVNNWRKRIAVQFRRDQ